MNIYALNLEQLIRDHDWDGIYALLISKIPIIIAALVILVLGFLFSDFIGKLVVKALRVKGVDPSIHSFVRSIVTFMLKLIFILSALSTIGVDISSFIAAVAAGGVAAGLGLQSSVSQFASGMEILINRPFRSGDFIDIGSVSGKVKEIKIMYTTLVTLDNRRVIIPNSTITASNIVNYNAENKRRIDLIFSISYDTDIEKAREALLSVARRNELIMEDPAPIIAVNEHAASSINLACLVWCDPNNYWPVFFYMQEESKKEFDKQGITIPFNQLDVHISKENLPIKV